MLPIQLTKHIAGDRIKLTDGTWNIKLRHGEIVRVDDERALRLLKIKVRGKPVVEIAGG